MYGNFLYDNFIIESLEERLEMGIWATIHTCSCFGHSPFGDPPEICENYIYSCTADGGTGSCTNNFPSCENFSDNP